VMTLAWICYDYDSEEPVFLLEELRKHMYARVVPIVFAKLKESE
jgi:hypothetical protein